MTWPLPARGEAHSNWTCPGGQGEVPLRPAKEITAIKQETNLTSLWAVRLPKTAFAAEFRCSRGPGNPRKDQHRRARALLRCQ
jgi:hypothetical protein